MVDIDDRARRPVASARRASWGLAAIACALAVAAGPIVAHAAPLSSAPPPAPAEPCPDPEASASVVGLDALMPPSMNRQFWGALVSPCDQVARDASDDERRTAADTELARAKNLYFRGKPEQALDAIDIAGCYVDEPEHDFMRGIVLVSLGRCDEARYAMDAFLGSSPTTPNALAVQEHLRACRPPPPPPPATLADDGYPPRARTPTDDARPWHRDPAAGILAALAASGYIAGTAFVVAAADTSERSYNASTGLTLAGSVGLVAASGFAIAAIVRYGRLHRAERARTKRHLAQR